MEPVLLPLISVEETSPGPNANGLATERRTSLFAAKRANHDTGTAVLSHADFPRSRSKSLPVAKVDPIPTKCNVKQSLYDIIKNVLEKGLNGKVYNENECEKQSRALVSAIKSRIISMKVPHFKFVCLCHISKNFEHSTMNIESGYAWDEEKTSVYKDIFVEYVYKNKGIVAIGSVHGIHCVSFNSSNFLKVNCRNYDLKRSSITEENESNKD